MNFFLALKLNQEAKKYVSSFCLDFPHLIQRTTQQDDYHITIGFIGPIQEKDRDIVAKSFTPLSSYLPIRLKGEKLGLFGYRENKDRYLSVIFNHDNTNLLLKLKQEAQNYLTNNTLYSFPSRDVFLPHVTLQLVRKNIPKKSYIDICDNFLQQPFKQKVFNFDNLALLYRCPVKNSYVEFHRY